MLTYLNNRRYQKLTRQLPSELQQEKKVFVDLFVKGPHWEEHFKPMVVHVSKKNFNEQKKYNCCPICLVTNTIAVPQYGKNHVCIKCRNLLRDQHGNQVKIFLDQEGDVVCLGFQMHQGKKYYYGTDYMHLQINGRKAYATFAQQLIILLKNL